MELFVKASRKQYRYDSGRGQLSTEDLWTLPLSTLDKIAVALDEQVSQRSGAKSFIGKRVTASTELADKLEILKYVITVKLTEEEEAKVKEDKRTQKDFLKNLLAKKKTEQLESLSAEEIEKQIAQLGE